MSDILDLYNSSDKQRPKESREKIPRQGVDMFDREKKFARGFIVNKTANSPTDFTEGGLNEYDRQLSDLTPPESFDPSKPLNRWNPVHRYNDPGNPKK